jgi:2-hydroxy-3-keto-5-methylthiopentenyl-1-phosphate phosphatase
VGDQRLLTAAVSPFVCGHTSAAEWQQLLGHARRRRQAGRIPADFEESYRLQQKAVTWDVLVDFDGTIAQDDPTDRLFERFADPYWRVLEEAWQRGRISSRECMQRQVELLRVSPEELDEQIANIRIDPSFRAFVEFCAAEGGDVRIVSDGLDRVVEGTLIRAGLAVPFFANRLEWQGEQRWRLRLPFARADCRSDAANCKCSHAQSLCSRPRVVVGDGRSDFCAATSADYVIARGPLVDHCRSTGKRHATFDSFAEVTKHLAAWLARKDDAAGRLSRPWAGEGVCARERRCA